MTVPVDMIQRAQTYLRIGGFGSVDQHDDVFALAWGSSRRDDSVAIHGRARIPILWLGG